MAETTQAAQATQAIQALPSAQAIQATQPARPTQSAQPTQLAQLTNRFGVNPNYKDSLFHMLFGTEEYKENALVLYNAITQTDHKLEELEITTIKDVIYMSVKNDASVIVGSELMLWEHQSTVNPNMPYRGLLYFASLYEGYEERHKLNRFGSRKMDLPTPKYYVFYNGTAEQPEQVELRFSDLYPGEGDLEVRATMLNINHEHNRELKERCQPLKDYTTLITMIRECEKQMPLADAVDHAVTECIRRGILADFLSAHRAEVKGMVLAEFDEAKYAELFRQEGRAEGREEGREDTIHRMTINLMRQRPELSEEEARKLVEDLAK